MPAEPAERRNAVNLSVATAPRMRPEETAETDATDLREPLGDSPPSGRDPRDRRNRRLLAIAVALFVVVTAVLSELRAIELWSTTWDLGIYQQALWSTAHGRPFYEAADWETGGYASFLQVHSSFVLYALVPLYAAAPAPLTLFVVQSSLVGLAAVPLYALVRARGGSSTVGLVASVLYLVWAPTLGGTIYDFHIEAFLPLVYLCCALGWTTRRYRLAALATAVGFLTMEVVPVLTFFLGVFLLLERIVDDPGWRGAPHSPVGARLRASAGRVLAREAWPLWALLVASILAYGALIVVRQSLLHDWFGLPPYPSVVASGYVTGTFGAGLGLSGAFLSVALFTKLSYWLMALALLGFLPLLYPRSLLLVLPWFLFTLFTPVTSFETFGFQYWLLAAGPLFVGVAFAAPRAAAALVRLFPARAAPASSRRRRALRKARSPVALILLSVGVANLAFSPLNPYFPYTTPGSAYQITYTGIVPSDGAGRLAALLPAGATVLASDDLFPLVANDLNAYSLLWVQDPNLTLPFDLGRLPAYALLSEFRLGAVPPFLTTTLYNPTDYGVRGVAWTSPTGPDLLFERGYSGPTATFGTPPSGRVEVPPRDLFTVAGVLHYVADPTAPGGAYVASVPGASGLIWDGPWAGFAPGNYTVYLTVRALPAAGTGPPDASTPVLTFASGAFAQPSWFVRTFTYAQLAGPGWRTITFEENVTSPTLEVTWPGYALDASVEIDVAGTGSAPTT